MRGMNGECIRVLLHASISKGGISSTVTLLRAGHFIMLPGDGESCWLSCRNIFARPQRLEFRAITQKGQNLTIEGGSEG